MPDDPIAIVTRPPFESGAANAGHRSIDYRMLRGARFRAHSASRSALPASRSTIRRRCSSLKLATIAARGSTFGRVSSSVQPGVQRVVWLDVTSLFTLVATDDDLVCNRSAATLFSCSHRQVTHSARRDRIQAFAAVGLGPGHLLGATPMPATLRARSPV